MSMPLPMVAKDLLATSALSLSLNSSQDLEGTHMAKYLRDIVLSGERDPEFTFKLETNFLEVLYINCLPKTQTDGIFKVIIQACRLVPTKKLDNMIDVLRLWKPFDFDAYFAADKAIRKRLALEFLQDGLLEVARIRGWKTDPFDIAYKAVLARGLVNNGPWRWCKPVTSPDRVLKAQAWVNYDSDKADVFLTLTRRNEVVAKVLVTSVKPGDVWINEAIGKLEWVSADEAKLTSRDGKQSWTVQAPKKQPKGTRVDS